MTKRNLSVLSPGELELAQWITVLEERDPDRSLPYNDHPHQTVSLVGGPPNRRRHPDPELPVLLSHASLEELAGVPLQIVAVRLPFVVVSSLRPFTSNTDYRYILDIRRFVVGQLPDEYIKAFKPSHSTTPPPSADASSVIESIRQRLSGSGGSKPPEAKPTDPPQQT